MEQEQLRVPPAAANQRLDQWLGDTYPAYSRSQLKAAIQKQQIQVNGQAVKPSYRLGADDLVTLALAPQAAPTPTVMPERLAFTVVYEDDDILVIDKPHGLVVHPSEGHQTGTLVNGLVAYAQTHGFTLPQGSAWYRPGIVHRLDKDTSGLMVVAKSPRAYTSLIEQFQAHAIHRGYRGLCYGEWTDSEGTIDAPIARDPHHRTRFTVLAGGQTAVTHFKRVARYTNYTLMDFSLETGRTHQIRVHTAFVNHPIADDPLYATNHKPQFFTQKGQLLHAKTLQLRHPVTGENCLFTADLPQRFQAVLDRLT